MPNQRRNGPQSHRRRLSLREFLRLRNGTSKPAFALKALEAEWYNTARGDYFDYARSTVDAVLADPNWNAPGRSPYADALLGEHLMLLYRVTQKPAYYEAAKQLRQRLSAACGLDRHPEREWLPCRAQPFLCRVCRRVPAARRLRLPLRAASPRGMRAPAAQPTDANADAGDRLLSLAWMASSLTDSLVLVSQQRSRPRPGAGCPEAGRRHSRTASGPALRPPAPCARKYQRRGLAHRGLALCLRALEGRPPRISSSELWHRRGTRAWHGALARYVRLDSSGRIILSGVSSVSANSTPDEAEQSSLGAFLLASTEMDLAPRQCRRPQRRRPSRRLVQQPAAQKRRRTDRVIPLQMDRLERLRLFALRPHAAQRRPGHANSALGAHRRKPEQRHLSTSSSRRTSRRRIPTRIT